MHLILNWLWQGVIVALAAEAVLALIPRSRTQARYCFAGLASVLVAALPAAPHIGAIAPSVSPFDDVSAAIGPVVSMPSVWWTSTRLVTAFWILWCVFCAARLGVAIVMLRAARRRCRDCPREV